MFGGADLGGNRDGAGLSPLRLRGHYFVIATIVIAEIALP
jgi:hypothetical protein